MCHKNVIYPKISYLNDFLITVARFKLFQIDFEKLPDTYCICVMCVTLPA